MSIVYSKPHIPSTPARRVAKGVLKVFGLYGIYIKVRERRKHAKLHAERVNSIIGYYSKFKPRVFVETGTYKGEMIDTMIRRFDAIYSVELSDALYADAVKKYANERHVKLFHGDSGVMLPKMLAEIQEPALFWLDAHFSGGETTRTDVDTPVEEELKVIFAHPVKNHVILIDDAREFVGKNNYPTLERVEKMATAAGYGFEVKNDNIRIYPKR
ncbi:MAG TPA: hypothetical protein VHE10_00685 [Candidatus Paceibacterota bacterium]|nr:hypothetical protein [Candidatus Paceibacterota bacterium]